MPRASSMCSSPAALTPVPAATSQIRTPRKVMKAPNCASRPATRTPPTRQLIMAIRARRLRSPLIAPNRLASALAEMPLGSGLASAGMDDMGSPHAAAAAGAAYPFASWATGSTASAAVFLFLDPVSYTHLRAHETPEHLV